MKRAAAALALVALVLGGSGVADAEQAADPLISPIDASKHPNVSTILTAPPELKAQALRDGSVTVTEDGVAQKASVQRLPAEELEVVLVIDTSASMEGSALLSAKAAASTFITRLPVDARVALVSFGSTPVLDSALGKDRAGARRAVQALRARGATALYDAVRLATRQFSGSTDSRRSIVVLSDGGDTVSAIRLLEVTAAIKAAGAHVDVIGLATTERDRATLATVAGAGAGRVASVDDPSALAKVYDGIAASLANQYTVKWRSTSRGSARVVVRVQQDGVVARSESVVRVQNRRGARPAIATGHVGSWMLAVGIGCVAAALFLFGLVGFAPRHRRRRARLGPARQTSPDVSPLSGMVSRATASADAALTRRGWRNAINSRLEQAGVALRPGEYVVLSLSAAVLAFALGFLTAGPIIGLLLAGAAGLAAHATLAIMRARRRSQFSEQLGDTLQQLAGSLRAGYGLLQAVDGLGRESSEPTRSEFRRLVVEARLGRDFSTSLHAMSERIGTDDFEWVVQAIDIHREVGGDLAEVLDTVAETIRERNQVMRQVKSLTAEGRLSAYILLALPILLAAALRVINPTYFVLLTSGAGLFLTGAAVVMLAMGALWFRKLCKLEY